MNNLINLLRKYNGKVARVLCHQSFVDFVAGVREHPTRMDGCPTVEVEMREEYSLELTDGRVVHQDGSVDESPLTQSMRIGIDEERVKVSAQRAEKEIKATTTRMGANLKTDSYRKSRT